MRAAVGIVALTALGGCSFVDHGECRRSHEQTILMPMVVGKMTILMPYTSTVCDEWEFPEGRPSAIRKGGA